MDTEFPIKKIGYITLDDGSKALPTQIDGIWSYLADSGDFVPINETQRIEAGIPTSEEVNSQGQTSESPSEMYKELNLTLAGKLPSLISYSRGVHLTPEQLNRWKYIKEWYAEYYSSVKLARYPILMTKIKETLKRVLHDYRIYVPHFQQISEVAKWLTAFQANNKGRIMLAHDEELRRERPLPPLILINGLSHTRNTRQLTCDTRSTALLLMRNFRSALLPSLTKDSWMLSRDTCLTASWTN